jgi:hypothetical protein
MKKPLPPKKPLLNPAFAAAANPRAATSGAPVRSPADDARVNKTDDRPTTLYLYAAESAKLQQLAVALYAEEIEQSSALVFRTALHLFDLGNAEAFRLADKEDRAGGERVQVYLYPHDKRRMREIGTALLRAGFARVTNGTIARLVIRALDASQKARPAFIAAARELQARYDERKKK